MLNTEKINRVEVIDHRTCENCMGKGVVLTEADSAGGQSTVFRKDCPTCSGLGSKGRQVILGGPAYGRAENVKVTISVQDQQRTLKIFIEEKQDEQ